MIFLSLLGYVGAENQRLVGPESPRLINVMEALVSEQTPPSKTRLLLVAVQNLNLARTPQFCNRGHVLYNMSSTFEFTI
jgi:hypothetical protein